MTEKMQLQRSFLRNPINSIGILLAIALLLEGLSWAAGYKIKMAYLEEVGGFWLYASHLVRGMVLPEMCTLYILIRLIEWYHKIFKIDYIEVTWPSISRYELRILPILLLAFFVFNPFTQTIRFFLEYHSNYNFNNFWSTYFVETYSVRIYIMYLVPVILIGYIAVNGSLVVDYMAYREETKKKAEAERERLLAQAQAIPTKTAAKSIYLTTVKGRNAQGEMIFPVEECCYFEVEDRYYYIIHPKGRYLISKTLNELETELDPAQFFRANRGAILNRRTVQSYAYWERGKYIVRLNPTCQQAEIALPRARLQEFRDWLAGDSTIDTPGPQSPMLTDSFGA